MMPEPQAPPGPLDPNLIYLPSEIAAYLRVAVRTLQSWRHRGGGPPFRKYGELVRYHGGDVLAWDASRRRRTTSDVPPLRVVEGKGLGP
jgi:hypothetical protein